MIGYCGILLALVAATPNAEAGVQTRPAASAADEAGDAYRDQARGAIREVLSRTEFSDLHEDP